MRDMDSMTTLMAQELKRCPVDLDVINYTMGDKYLAYLPGVLKYTLNVTLKELVHGDGPDSDNPPVEYIFVKAYLRSAASIYIEDLAAFEANEGDIDSVELGRPKSFCNLSGRGPTLDELISDGDEEEDGLDSFEFGIVLPSFADVEQIRVKYSDEDGLLTISVPYKEEEEYEDDEEYVEEDYEEDESVKRVFDVE